MYFLWGGLCLLYSVSFADTCLLKGDPGGLVMAIVAVLFAILCARSWRKRKQKKEVQKR